VPAEANVQTRSDLTWAITAGGIATVSFAILIGFAWYFSGTLFLIFAGILLGVALNA
jgi:ethanolamine utilization microcompartment shell protein EutS